MIKPDLMILSVVMDLWIPESNVIVVYPTDVIIHAVMQEPVDFTIMQLVRQASAVI